ncbi:DUF551 domain-containing protein [Salmonella enterica subsp. enterica serovar Newport]|nr:DUF551 domain-containing protein [Salmonella enterica subsp. enterica serovar Newport]
MKENQIRELVNELHDIAIEYHGTQQLRERIARTVRAAIIQAGNSPVIGIDMASEPDRSVEVRYLAPPGYVMVPKVVTPEIGNAINEVGQRCTCGNCSQRLWDLLLASAPVQVDIEMLASTLKNAPLAPSDNQGRPRAPVVPPAIEPDYKVIKGILPTANPDEYACCIAADMWDACRAAMLQGDEQPQNARQNIPDGNSPVIPDGWISCSERMPDNDESKPIAIFTGKCLGQGMFVATYDDDGFFDYWEGMEIIGVTHWMPLPAAPQQ